MGRVPQGLRELMSAFPFTGTVVWIGVRPAPRALMVLMQSVEAIAGRGLAGDRTAEKSRPGNARQVTLIQAEHLEAMGRLLRCDGIDPALTRRNVVVSGVNLLSLKGHRFAIGSAVFEMTGDCHPCSLMEHQLGTGGYNAMRGHGGITARVVESGTVRIGALVTPLEYMDSIAIDAAEGPEER